MSHKNILFQQVKQQIPRHVFASVERRFFCPGDARKLSNTSLFLLWAYIHINNIPSLRCAIDRLNTCKERFYHLGINYRFTISTLSEAIGKRTYKFFQELFIIELASLKRRYKKRLDFPVQLLDATHIHVNHKKMIWDKFKNKAKDVKVHVQLAGYSALPIHVEVTSGAIGDITVAKKLDFKPGTILLMDRGYFNSKWWLKLNKDGVIFVSRLRKDVVYYTIRRKYFREPDQLTDDWYIYEESTIQFQGNDSQNYSEHLRLITLKNEKTKETLQIVTNDFKMRKESIAQLYKSRWDVELFFKWLKQNLQFRKFIPLNSNALQMQLWSALLVYLLVWKMHQQSNYQNQPILQFLRYLQARLFLPDQAIKFSTWKEKPPDKQAFLFIGDEKCKNTDH